MLSVSARPLLKTPIATRFAPLRRRSAAAAAPITHIRMSSTVEHIVLFKVKEGSDTSPMLTGLNALKTLTMVQHLSAGPLHRTRSTSLTFTHLLHSRYQSKEDLASYSAHPAHLDVVRSSVLPICDDIMAVDWVADNIDGSSGPKPGSAIRVQFVKLKEGLGEKEKGEVLEVIGGLKEKVNGIEELTFGENFSPARGKGFTIASIGVFPGIGELDGVDQSVEISGEKEKVRVYIDDVVVDYVVPSPQSSSL